MAKATYTSVPSRTRLFTQPSRPGEVFWTFRPTSSASPWVRAMMVASRSCSTAIMSGANFWERRSSPKVPARSPTVRTKRTALSRTTGT